jgi:hypothetical protein
MGDVRNLLLTGHIEQAGPKFINLVGDGKKYDIKDKMLKYLQGKSTNLGNGWFEYSTAGNILFGFYGESVGFSPLELHVGAGYAQVQDFILNGDHPFPGSIFTFFDTPDDYYAVKFGGYLYQNYYIKNQKLTRDDLVEALQNFPDKDKLAHRPPPQDFEYEPADYDLPPNWFYQ